MHKRITRRNFLGTTSALAAAPLLSPLASFAQGTQAAPKGPAIWSLLLHLGQNMWGDASTAYTPPVDYMTWDYDFWKEVTETMAQSGLNMVVIDLGEAIKYESHPEIATKGAWSVEQLREDLARLRKLGLEPIPKLNFSACHDLWLGEYARMVSTKKYYEVCSDLIKEVTEIFDKPRFFHLGYDEETFGHQRTYDYIVIRQNELWKHDFLFFINECEKNQTRPWIWADYYWNHKDFLNWAPKSIVMSNWYYSLNFDLNSEDKDNVNYVQTFLDLDKAGFDQIPTGSNWSNDENFGLLVKFCKENLSSERLLGYLQTNWHFEHENPKQHILNSIKLEAEAKY